jgi:glycosyltransferase involved in cell wall biosynthesis
MSAREPEISVVVGVRDGGAETLPSVASVLSQEGVELELIVVDDGSTDETPEVLAGLARRDPRVRVIRQEAEGLTAALIRGCAAARGELIARQDIGDASLPGRLARQRDALRRWPEVVLVSCWSEKVGPGGEMLAIEQGLGPSGRPATLSELRETELVVLAGPSSHGSTMFRRDAYLFVGGYRAPFRMAQDWDLWLRLGEVGKLFKTSATLYQLRIEPTSLSFSRKEIQCAFGALAVEAGLRRRNGLEEQAVLEHCQSLAARFVKNNGPSRRSLAIGNYHVGSLLRHGRDPRCRRYFVLSLRHDPLYWKAWLALLAGPVSGVSSVDSEDSQFVDESKLDGSR